MNLAQLETTAKALVAPGKGILAADESTGTIAKRFKSIQIENTEDNRRAYRDMLFTAKGAADFISGVILYDETIRQKGLNGKTFVAVLNDQSIIPGIKVDLGAKPLANSPEEMITEGLDGLRERLKEYWDLGARFAKWRAVINIGKDIPTGYSIHANADALARYAALCQETNIVPIVEPEVIMDGNHTVERCYEVTEKTLRHVFAALNHHRVALSGILLKPNMVVSGTECSKQASVKEVAELTLKCFRNTVPAEVPGIVFLSGGQSDELATAHLNAMNQSQTPKPWRLSFSYGRALQAPSLKAWGGRKENVARGQQAYFNRAKFNSAATYGKYSSSMENDI